jgi:hypothetical protein
MGIKVVLHHEDLWGVHSDMSVINVLKCTACGGYVGEFYDSDHCYHCHEEDTLVKSKLILKIEEVENNIKEGI